MGECLRGDFSGPAIGTCAAMRTNTTELYDQTLNTTVSVQNNYTVTRTWHFDRCPDVAECRSVLSLMIC
jgi:hypothetical protein